MIAKVTVTGLAEAEEKAKEILEHVEAIKRLQTSMPWPGCGITVELKTEEMKNEADGDN